MASASREVVNRFETLHQVLDFVLVLHSRHAINPIGVEEGLIVERLATRRPSGQSNAPHAGTRTSSATPRAGSPCCGSGL